MDVNKLHATGGFIYPKVSKMLDLLLPKLIHVYSFMMIASSSCIQMIVSYSA